jgi:hypothetical protein
MARPVTLVTGQWADLKLARPSAKSPTCLPSARSAPDPTPRASRKGSCAVCPRTSWARAAPGAHNEPHRLRVRHVPHHAPRA